MKIITPDEYFKEICYDVYFDDFFDSLDDDNHLILLLEKLCEEADKAMMNGG